MIIRKSMTKNIIYHIYIKYNILFSYWHKMKTYNEYIHVCKTNWETLCATAKPLPRLEKLKKSGLWCEISTGSIYL